MKRLISLMREMTWREYILAIVMLLAWITALVLFIRNPTKTYLIIGSSISALCFVLLCKLGEELPSEEIWRRYTDISFVCLLVMYITDLVMSVCCFPSIRQIFSMDFLWFTGGLTCAYLFIVIFCVFGVIGYKDEKMRLPTSQLENL